MIIPEIPGNSKNIPAIRVEWIDPIHRKGQWFQHTVLGGTIRHWTGHNASNMQGIPETPFVQ